jgi:hypothetical protein
MYAEFAQSSRLSALAVKYRTWTCPDGVLV